MSGPLAGTRVVELGGIGPVPFATMMLADLGADVIRVDRADPGEAAAAAGVRGGTAAVPPDGGSAGGGPHPDVVRRGRRSIVVDLKHPEGRRVVLDLVARADVLLEGFRPGVTERLGLGPDACAEVNPRLVYGRMTGWGQEGPLAATAGHDITYLAVTGALHASRRAGQLPVPPLNLLGDLGGGAAFLAFGVVAALLEAARSGRGQVVDAAVVDGTAALTTFVAGLRAQGLWDGPPGGNLLDTGAPFYDVYACADGGEIAVGALEPAFYAALLGVTGVAQDDPVLGVRARLDRSTWPAAKARWAAVFAGRTRADWVAAAEGTDACLAPVLDWDEAPRHPHLAARGTFFERDGTVQSAPAPRFSRSRPVPGRPPPRPGTHTDEILRETGRDAAAVAALRRAGAVS